MVASSTSAKEPPVVVEPPVEPLLVVVLPLAPGFVEPEDVAVLPLEEPELFDGA